MDEAKRRSQTSKGGPRVLTITPNIVGGDVVFGTVNNCPNCTIPTGWIVWNEDSVQGQVDLLVHGWYSLETDINIFWQQVNPRDACATNPRLTGRRLSGGQCMAIFVDQSTIDGVIVINTCAQELPALCNLLESSTPALITEGLIRINRVDTVKKMSETGDSATDMVPAPSAACGG